MSMDDDGPLEPSQGTCVECEDQPAELECLRCEEAFCKPCWTHQHRRGKRAQHPTRVLLGEVMPAPEVLADPSKLEAEAADAKDASNSPAASASATLTAPSQHTLEPAADATPGSASNAEDADMSTMEEEKDATGAPSALANGHSNGHIGGDVKAAARLLGLDVSAIPAVALGAATAAADAAYESDASSSEAEWDDGAAPSSPLKSRNSESKSEQAAAAAAAAVAAAAAARAVSEAFRYVPMRLSMEERRLLALLQSALSVSEYTDRVDVLHRYNRHGVVEDQLRRMLHLLCGLCIAGDVAGGQRLVKGRRIADNMPFFQRVFEVGRRYKIQNPDKMRNYGKMMFMLQDSVAAKLNGYDLVKDIETVHTFLAARGGLGLLGDPKLADATHEFTGRGLTAEQIRALSQRKAAARQALIAAYGSGGTSSANSRLTAEDVARVLDSVADANNYVTHNVLPVERMLLHLHENFKRDSAEEPFSLRLMGGYKSTRSSSFSGSYDFFSGYGGYGSFGSRFSSSAKLCHDHATQFTFVQQSLSLWAEAMRSMFRLWYNADADLLSGRASYKLYNTGQGLNRVQSCPSVSDEMRRVLSKVKAKCGPWVGLSVVHLGDRDVPNALVFIDKYAQIPRILTPVADTVDRIDELCQDAAVEGYIAACWETKRNLKMQILADFFKHAFDGDGDDGGSCIDGRLTSAWNWCSRIAKKPYYHIFGLAGFQGFDGDWRE